jgi:hypothetical protein
MRDSTPQEKGRLLLVLLLLRRGTVPGCTDSNLWWTLTHLYPSTVSQVRIEAGVGLFTLIRYSRDGL